MRGGLAEPLFLIGAVNGMAFFSEKHSVRHGRIVPLLAVPDLIHGTGSVSSRGRRVASQASRNRPLMLLHTVHKNAHLLSGFVNVDEDGGGNGARIRQRRRLCQGLAADIPRVVPGQACLIALMSGKRLA